MNRESFGNSQGAILQSVDLCLRGHARLQLVFGKTRCQIWCLLPVSHLRVFVRRRFAAKNKEEKGELRKLSDEFQLASFTQ